jgi:glucuronate isomerase
MTLGPSPHEGAAPVQPRNPDRLFPSDPTQRALARELYARVRDLPLLSPHGHVDPALLADDRPFPDPARLLIVPDHYLTRMLLSQGVPPSELGVPTLDGTPSERDGHAIWRTFAAHWHLFRPGAVRNHNRWLHRTFGRDTGGDIPAATDSVHGLAPLLDRYGNDPRLRLVLFTLDETAFSRELAPLAGGYPAVYLGAPWWFLDSPEGMRRFRETVTETAGFYNTVGFTDDTRAFCSIPVRHDVARRVDAAFLARLVAEERLPLDEAAETIVDLTYRLPKRVYRLERHP